MSQNKCGRKLAVLAAVFATMFSPQSAAAQTDFLNTDGGRPLRVQDALSIEWRALELQFAPLRLERHRDNSWQMELEPEIAFGILPRTHFSVGFPVASVPKPAPPISLLETARSNLIPSGSPFAEAPAALDVEVGPQLESNGQINGLAGLHLSLFHQLNVETRIPALAVRAEVLLPVGPLSPARAYPSLTAIATRTIPALGPVRMHGNATITFGEAPRVRAADEPEVAMIPRWSAGMSLDRAFPLQSTLVAAEVLAHLGMFPGANTVWSAGSGVRHQFSPRLVLDLGVARELSGPDNHWSFTAGSAIALGLGRRLF